MIKLFMTLCFLQIFFPNHLEVAMQYIGTTEATGKNDGKQVEMFLNFVGRKKGESWCAAFVSYCLDKAKVKYPKVRSGLARSFKLKNSISANEVLRGRKIPIGTIVIWEKGNTIFGHIGFVIQWEKEKGVTIEGNTKSERRLNPKNYDGVFIRNRKIEPANYFRITAFTIVENKNYE